MARARARKRGVQAGASMNAPPADVSVASPCINLCQMDAATGLCQGCLRTIDEIVGWSGAGDAFKRAVWAEIRRREALIDFD